MNRLSHGPCVGFQFLKLFWNPYTMFGPSYGITFCDWRHIEDFFSVFGPVSEFEGVGAFLQD